MRIGGVVTSIRLEKFFWLLLEEISIRDSLSVAQLTTKLYLEAIDAEHDIANFTSFLRVCCSRYLSLVADKQLARDELTPLSDIEATSILDTEEKISPKDNKVLIYNGLTARQLTNKNWQHAYLKPLPI